MKQIAVVFRVFLLATVLVSLAACSGGTFVDPGHEVAGSSSGGVSISSRPAKLSSNASYNEALAKLNEIIVYCSAHPGAVNNEMKEYAEMGRDWIIDLGERDWRGSTASDVIDAINDMIDQLE
jgi:hypothetical protein